MTPLTSPETATSPLTAADLDAADRAARAWLGADGATTPEEARDALRHSFGAPEGLVESRLGYARQIVQALEAALTEAERVMAADRPAAPTAAPASLQELKAQEAAAEVAADQRYWKMKLIEPLDRARPLVPILRRTVEAYASIMIGALSDLVAVRHQGERDRMDRTLTWMNIERARVRELADRWSVEFVDWRLPHLIYSPVPAPAPPAAPAPERPAARARSRR